MGWQVGWAGGMSVGTGVKFHGGWGMGCNAGQAMWGKKNHQTRARGRVCGGGRLGIRSGLCGVGEVGEGSSLSVGNKGANGGPGLGRGEWKK